LVIRGIGISSPEVALADRSRVAVTATIRATVTPRNGRAAVVSVRMPGRASAFVDAPFFAIGPCPVGMTCSAGVLAVARWTGELGADADITWSAHLVATFVGASTVPAGVAIPVGVDRRFDITDASQRLSATASGAFDLARVSGCCARGSGRFSVATTAGLAYFSGEAPPATGLLTFRAIAKGATTDGVVTVRLPPRPGWGEVVVQVPIGGESRPEVVYPLEACRSRDPCEGTIDMLATGPDGNAYSLEWDLTVDLPYNHLAPPPAGSQLRVTVDTR
jgi:hypothetical protein